MPRQKTRVLILSDTHGALPGKDAGTPEFLATFPRADIAIHCGDLTMTGQIKEHKKALELIKTLPAELKIVIPGNHDLTLDREYCAKQHEQFYGWETPSTQQDLDAAHDLYTNDEAKAAGIVYMMEGIRSFELSNGTTFTVYASAYTPEFCDWGFAYPRTEDRYNSDTATNAAVPDWDGNDTSRNIDIMITHGPPRGILDGTFDGLPVGCEHLRTAVCRSRPVVHCFGHIHEAWGSVRVDWRDADNQNPFTRIRSSFRKTDVKTEETPVIALDATDLVPGQMTQFVNASVMDIRYRPVQKPWLVDVMLPRSRDGR